MPRECLEGNVPSPTPQQLLKFGLWQFRLYRDAVDEDMECMAQESIHEYLVAPNNSTPQQRRQIMQYRYGMDWQIGQSWQLAGTTYDDEF